jgi:hypothetical protein
VSDETQRSSRLRRKVLPGLAEVVVYLLAAGLAYLCAYEISAGTGPSTRPQLPETLNAGSTRFTPSKLAAIPTMAIGRRAPLALAPVAPVLPATGGGGAASAPSPSAPAPPPILEPVGGGPTLEPASP